MAAFMSNVTPGDIVNVRLALQPGEPALVHRARVLRIHGPDETHDLRVELPDGEN